MGGGIGLSAFVTPVSGPCFVQRGQDADHEAGRDIESPLQVQPT